MTSTELRELINEIRRERAMYIQFMEDKNGGLFGYDTAQMKKQICEQRISDLSIALELAKELEEIKSKLTK